MVYGPGETECPNDTNLILRKTCLMEKYYSTHSTSERERLLTFKKKTTLLKYLELKTGFASELLLPVNTGEP